MNETTKPYLGDLIADAERYNALRAAVLTYDDAIRKAASSFHAFRKPWVEGDELDVLYEAMIRAAGRQP